MLCILCLKPPIEPINIFGEKGVCLDIEGVITKHFWFSPFAEDPLASSICSPCWNSLDSFHQFFNNVEKAHQLNSIMSKKCDTTDQDATVGVVSNEEYNSFLTTSIKIEVNENSNDQPLEFEEDLPHNDPLKIVNIDKIDLNIKSDSDSESEIPISKLLNQFKKENNNVPKKKVSSTKHSKEKKTKSTEVIYHIKNGEWLATCYGEETTDKRISHEEFDKFIKKSLELFCNLCSKPMTNFTALQTHVQNEHTGEKAYATCCGKKFFLRAPLTDHILLHKLPNYFTCVQCFKVLTGRKTLIEHQKIHNKKLVYKCHGCDKSFHRKINLDRHKDVHVDYSERIIECSHCDKLFASKFSLKQHIYDVHKIGSNSNIVCELCGKICRDQPSFKRHQYEHTNEQKETFPCEICGTCIATKDGLRRHKKSQHPADDKKYFCNYCGLQSTTAHALHHHVTYMHTGEPKHKCTVCGKAFKRALRLKRKVGPGLRNIP